MFRVSGCIKFWDPSRGLWHWWSEFTYHKDGILICFSILISWTLCERPMRRRQKALFCWFLFFGSALIVCGWGVVRWGRESYLGPAKIASSSNQDFSRSDNYNRFWHVALTGYFFVLFLWVIAVSDVRPLEIYKNLDLSLSTITPTVITATHITIPINMFICFKYYTVSASFFN